MDNKKVFSETLDINGYNDLQITFGQMACQCDGSVMVRSGDAVLLATVVYAKTPSSDTSFLPLLVSYQEKYYAFGRIPGGSLKRENKLVEREILISRLVDRTLRPMFCKDFHNEIQINISLLSNDNNILPEYLACFTASLAVLSSGIPFIQPVSEVYIANINGDFVVNPVPTENKHSEMEFVVGGSKESIIMVEGKANKVSNTKVLSALEKAKETISKICVLQEEIIAKVGKTKIKCETSDYVDIPETLKNQIAFILEKGISDYKERKNALNDVIGRVIVEHPEWKTAIDNSIKDAITNLAITQGKRLDGRALGDIRSISAEVDLLPSAHGSALFTRGETQALVTVTLGSKLDEQQNDGLIGNRYSRFIVHYNFPGFATGEVKNDRGISRREIGHGYLALKAISGVLPGDDVNPFTIRIVSDILSSNGSSSMATVCGGCLALMDAGVPITDMVAGIALGILIDKKTGKYAILSDICADEDAHGDMDFKIAGTENSITAIQLDVKTVGGLTLAMCKEILQQASNGLNSIIGEMKKCSDHVRNTPKDNAPYCSVIPINKEMIGALIGVGGKVIQTIQKNSSAILSIEEKDGKGVVRIFGPTLKSLQKAEAEVRNIIDQPVVNEVYDSVVKEVYPYGAIVEFWKNKVGMLLKEDVDWATIDNLVKVLHPGDRVTVKLLEILPHNKYKLSHKVLIKNEQPNVSVFEKPNEKIIPSDI